MKEDALKRFLDLVEKTGDKVIVTDPAGEHPYVLMSLDQYERLMNGAPAAAPALKPAAKQVSRGPGLQRETTVLWKPQQAAKAPVRPRLAPALAVEAAIDAEGEEQFFLEPLE